MCIRDRLVGEPNMMTYKPPVPIGMVYVPSGVLKMGASDEDVRGKNDAMIRTAQLTGFYMDATETVSYTHLDVYKRQQHYVLTADEPSLQHALKSLDAMLDGGIYDQIGGGLARYATDDKWLIPHFEKMLYDNALLVSVLCDAYAVTKNNRYKAAIDEIIAFVERELKDPTGGYLSLIHI